MSNADSIKVVYLNGEFEVRSVDCGGSMKCEVLSVEYGG